MDKWKLVMRLALRRNVVYEVRFFFFCSVSVIAEQLDIPWSGNTDHEKNIYESMQNRIRHGSDFDTL